MLTKVKQLFAEGKNLITFTGIKALGQALGMIAPLVVAKFFSPELFGSYSLAKMVVFFFISFLIASSQTPFIVLANQEKVQNGKINKVFSVQLTFLILGFFVFTAIMLSLSKYIAAFAKISRGDLFFVLLAFIGLALKTFLGGLFMAMAERIKSSLVELVFGSLSLVLIFMFYLLDMISLRSVFTVYFISAVVVAGVFVRAIDFKILLPFKLEKKHFREMFDFTKWVFLGATAVYFINWGDLLVLRYFVPMGDIGVYSFGYSLFKGSMILISALGAYFLPFISQNINNPMKIREYLYNKRPKIFLAGIVAIAICFLLVPHALNMIYGETYQKGGTVLRILLIATVIYMYNLFYAPILSALKRYRFVQTINAVQVLVNVIMNIVLIPTFGMFGAAIATVLAYICRAVIFELYFRLKLKKLFLTER